MQLPPEFPHTRREQYLVALPMVLLTRAEMARAIAVLHRARLHVTTMAEMCATELLAQGYSDDDIERAAFPRLPPALYPHDDHPEAQERTKR